MKLQSIKETDSGDNYVIERDCNFAGDFVQSLIESDWNHAHMSY